MTTPPIDFGMDWQNTGLRTRRGYDLPLHVAATATDTFSDAYRHARASMVSAGYSWTDAGTGKLAPCWWDHDIDVDVPSLQAAVDAALAVGAAERAEKARVEEERLAARQAAFEAEVAEIQISGAPIRERLDALLAGRPWSFGRHLADARRLAEDSAWGRYSLRDAERLVGNAGDVIERAEARLGRPAPATWFARAEDPDIRSAALEACRFLSARDEDWASARNSIGWSQATSWTGHVLSERDALDQGQAGHALALLHTHRRQLPAELRARCFEGAPPAEPASALLL